MVVLEIKLGIAIVSQSHRWEIMNFKTIHAMVVKILQSRRRLWINRQASSAIPGAMLLTNPKSLLLSYSIYL